MHKAGTSQIVFSVDAMQKERFCYILAASGHKQNWLLSKYVDEVVDKYERTYGSIADIDIVEWRQPGKVGSRRIRKTAMADMIVTHSGIET